MFGKNHSDSAKAKISAATSGKSNPRFDVQVSESTKVL